MYRDVDPSMGDIVVQIRAAEDGVTRRSRLATGSNKSPILPGRLMEISEVNHSGDIPHGADRKNRRRCSREEEATAAARELHHTDNTMGEVASIQEGREPIVTVVGEVGCNQVAEDDESNGRVL